MPLGSMKMALQKLPDEITLETAVCSLKGGKKDISRKRRKIRQRCIRSIDTACFGKCPTATMLQGQNTDKKVSRNC